MHSILRRHLRLKAFGASTEVERSAERYRLAAWSAAANYLSKGLSMLVVLASVSWTLPYLGAERFGVWMTIASFAAMLLFLDLGVGNALTNRVANASASGSEDSTARAVSGGLALLGLLGLFMAAGLSVAASWIPWARVVRLEDPSVVAEARQAVIWFAVLFGAHLLSAGVHRVFAGLQRAYEAHAVNALSSVCALLALFMASEARAGVPILLIVTFGIPIAGSLLLLGILNRRRLLATGGLVDATRQEAGPLLRTGSLFLLLQLGTMVGWGADGLIVASTLGASSMAVYAVTQRLFQFVVQPLAIANAPLWAAYADAHARRDVAFVKRALIASLRRTGAAATVGALFLAVFGRALIEAWTGSTALQVSASLLAIWAIWTVVECVGNAWAMFMNGCGLVRPQVVAVICFCLVALPLKFLLVTRFGLPGLLAGTLVAYCLCVPGLYALAYRHAIRFHIDREIKAVAQR